MLLVVDVGNTQTHFGVFRDGEDRSPSTGGSRPCASRPATSSARRCRTCSALRGLSLDEVDASIVSSTVPQLSEQWTQMAERYLAQAMLVVGPSIRTGMPIRMDNPHEVGADRLVNAVAAYDHVHGTCVVVDFGTAITYDVVSAAGEYLGRDHHPGRRDLDRRPVRPRRQAARRSSSPSRAR